MYISEWDLQVPLTTTCATREKYTPRDMAFLHVYISGLLRCSGRPPAYIEWDLHGACDYYLCGIYTRDMAFLHISEMGYCTTEKYRDMAYVYQNGIYTVPPPCYQQPGEIHPGTWHSSMYISDGIWCRHWLLTACATREKYTQGHGIPPYISEWDLNGCRH
jgi:hypothetical protein